MSTDNYEVKIFKLLPRVFADRSAILSARAIVKCLRQLQPEAFSEAKDYQLTTAIANLARKKLYKGQLKSCRDQGCQGYRLGDSFDPNLEPPLVAPRGRPLGSVSTVGLRHYPEYKLADVYAQLMKDPLGKGGECFVAGREDIQVAIDEKQRRSVIVKVETGFDPDLERPKAPFLAPAEFSPTRGELVFRQKNTDSGEGYFTDLFAAVIGEFIANESSSVIIAEEFVDAVERERKRQARGINSNCLSAEEERGLIGELWFLLNVVIPNCDNAEVAVEAWHGPDRAPIDFWFGAGCVEMKTSFDDAKNIQISSVRQLDTPGVRNLFLAHLKLTTHPSGTAGMTLPGYVEAVKKVLPQHVWKKFEDKLTKSQTGEDGKGKRYYDRDKRHYTDSYYVDPLDPLAFYKVPTDTSTEEAKAFPRFTQSELEARGIEVSKYSIEIAQLGEAEEYSEVIQKLFSSP